MPETENPPAVETPPDDDDEATKGKFKAWLDEWATEYFKEEEKPPEVEPTPDEPPKRKVGFLAKITGMGKD